MSICISLYTSILPLLRCRGEGKEEVGESKTLIYALRANVLISRSLQVSLDQSGTFEVYVSAYIIALNTRRAEVEQDILN